MHGYVKARFGWILAGLVGLGLVAGVAAGVAAMVAQRQAGGAGASQRPAARAGEGREVSLGEFTTNLAERGSAVQVTFVLIVPGEKEAARVEAARSELRDAVLGLLRDTRAADLSGAQGKDRLARSVLARVNQVLGEPVVNRVLVTDIVAQP